MDKNELLTTDEIGRIKMLADLGAWFLDSAPKGMINDNFTSFIEGVNHLQILIMARAAQRAFPEHFDYDPEREGRRALCMSTLSETFCDPK